jgi:hypothetical protein
MLISVESAITLRTLRLCTFEKQGLEYAILKNVHGCTYILLFVYETDKRQFNI